MAVAASAAPRLGSTLRAGSLPAVPIHALGTIFRERYVTHLLIPSVLLLAFVRVWSGAVPELVAYVVASSLLVSAARRAAFDLEPFAAWKLRRVASRALALFAALALGSVLYAFLSVPLGLLGALGSAGAQASAVAAGIGSFGLVFARFWPAYALPHLRTGTETFSWSAHLRRALPDLRLAWRLTAAPGTLSRATLPVAIAALPAVALAVVAHQLRGTGVGLATDFALFLVALPLAHLVVVERAATLATESGGAASDGFGRLDPGPLRLDALDAPDAMIVESPPDELDAIPVLRAAPRWRLADAIGLPSGVELDRIERALSAARRLADGASAPLDVAERTVLARRCLATLRRIRPLQARSLDLLLEGRTSRFRGLLRPEHAVLVACEILDEARPELGAWECRRRVVRAQRAFFDPDFPGLDPEDHLLWQGDPVAAPDVSETADELLADGGARYWERPLYRRLWTTAADRLADDVALALVSLVAVEVDPADEGAAALPLRTLLERYGPRLFPAVVEYLRRPHLHARADAEHVLWSAYAPLFFEVVRAWPRHLAEPIFRSALASGWDVERFLADPDWGRDVLRAYADGPYRR